MYQDHLPPSEFAARRAAVLDALGSGACALVAGAPKERGHDLFRQSAAFYYLCGVEVPHAYLLLNAAERKSTLFLPHQSPERREADGEILSPENAERGLELTGIDAIRPLEALSFELAKIAKLYLPMTPSEGRTTSWDTLRRAQAEVDADPWDGRPSREARLCGLLASRHPRMALHDLDPILNRLRLVKSPAEIALLRRSGDICARALVEAMRSTREGVAEYELAAVMRYVFLVNGARDEGYRAIIAGGANAWYPHYNRNDQRLRAGDLVLVDYAPDYRYYTSDIGRMWPVSGRYSPAQREVYGFVVAYHKLLLAHIRPGLTPAQIIDETAREAAGMLARFPFSKPLHAEAARRMIRATANLSHPVGLAVHDVGDYHAGALEPGMVFSVDPILLVPEERLYIRVEDTVAVTSEGVEVLTRRAPLELDEVEAMLAQTGLLALSPPDVP